MTDIPAARARLVYQMREDEKKTFREIGEVFGFSATRATQLYNRHARIVRRRNPEPLIPTKALEREVSEYDLPEKLTKFNIFDKRRGY